MSTPVTSQVQIEDAILAAINADAQITAWNVSVISSAVLIRAEQRHRGNYPWISVVYEGTPDPAGYQSGGTGCGGNLQRRPVYLLNIAAKNYRAADQARRGGPPADPTVGCYEILDRLIEILVYKNLGLSMGRLRYAGDRHVGVIVEGNSIVAAQYELRIAAEYVVAAIADNAP